MDEVPLYMKSCRHPRKLPDAESAELQEGSADNFWKCRQLVKGAGDSGVSNDQTNGSKGDKTRSWIH